LVELKVVIAVDLAMGDAVVDHAETMMTRDVDGLKNR
jgi:hypothetical protein